MPEARMRHSSNVCDENVLGVSNIVLAGAVIWTAEYCTLHIHSFKNLTQFYNELQS